MIAWQGILEHDAGRTDDSVSMRQKERTDEVRVSW